MHLTHLLPLDMNSQRRQRHPKDSSPPRHTPPQHSSVFPINYLSSLIGLFLDLSSLPERLVTLALFSLVLHLVLAFRTPSRPLVPSTQWTRAVYSDCVTLLCTAQIPAGTVVACSTQGLPPNELDRHDPSGRGLHSSRCTRLNCEVLCMLLTLQLLQVLQCGIH